MRTLFFTALLFAATQLFAAPVDLAAGHDVAFYSKLRFDYAARKGFSPHWASDEKRKTVDRAYKLRDTERTITLGRAWLDSVPVDAEVYLMIAMCMKEKGDLKAMCQYLSAFYGLLQSITATGDGKTPETAFKIISVAEEYALLREIGAEVKSQSLVGPCDKMEVERNGKEYTFYFDVRIPLKAEADALESNE
ncbi:MAG: DUF4919 domain-containing protein [Blastocatellia bacterium]|nr:DUF4919 domain-containing protein [Blastocatellia bacterium]